MNQCEVSYQCGMLSLYVVPSALAEVRWEGVQLKVCGVLCHTRHPVLPHLALWHFGLLHCGHSRTSFFGVIACACALDSLVVQHLQFGSFLAVYEIQPFSYCRAER